MDTDKINIIALRTVCVIFSAFLVIGGIGACINHQYIKGGVGILVAPILVFIGFKPPSLTTWGLLVGGFFVTMYLVGLLGN